MATPSTDQAARFRKLFAGYTLRYGVNTPLPERENGKRLSKNLTLTQKITPKDYAQHLAGKRLIGVVPLTEDNRIFFGCIDIDVYDDGAPGWHEQLARRIRRLPLACTRSKSDGLHVWLHSSAGLPPKIAVDFLETVAAHIGFGGSEIFPKQTYRDPKTEDVGNWVNLPFANGDRRGVWWGEEDGKLALGKDDLESFLALAERNSDLCTEERILEYTRELRVGNADADQGADWKDGPPCLQRLLLGTDDAPAQLVPGQRNDVFFDASVYLNRKHADESTVTDILVALDGDKGHGLGASEIARITKSAVRKTYTYRCTKPHLARVCERSLCLKREFGIKLSAGDEVIAFGDIVKVTTEPPRYIVTAEGRAVTMSAHELLNLPLFNERVFEAVDRKVSRTRAEHDVWCDSLRARMKYCDPPVGGDMKSTIRELLLLFMDEAAERTNDDRRFFIGRVITRNDEAWFQIRHFKKFLQRDGMRPKPAELSETLQSLGCWTKHTTIEGKSADPWIAYPEKLRAA